MITIPGKIPISIHPLFWLVAFFIGWVWTGQLAAAFICVLIILFSVLFHEFGHALTASVFGQKTRISLAAFGGFTYREGRKLKLWEEFIVVLNGPLCGFLLFLIAFGIFKAFEITNPILLFAVKFTYIANLFWTIINLIPVLPLDGGHLLSIVLEGIFGFKGIKMAIIAGLVIAVAISITFFAMGMYLVGALFLILTFESFRSLRYYKVFSEQDRNVDFQKLFSEANDELNRGEIESAAAKFQQVREQTQKGILYNGATQALASIYRSQKRFDEAYELLQPLSKQLGSDALPLFHYLAFMNRDYKTVVEIAARVYQDAPTADVALINALASGALGDTEPAVGWLTCAKREGLTSMQESLARAEFDPIREDRQFEEFRKSC